MAKGYFTSKISENLEETPEGFLIARDTVIARTGWQQYKVGELPQETASQLGVDVQDGNADIDLYRAAEDVFRPETLASFEGKPVTDNHPPGFVEPNNFSEYARGHIQNVRRGRDALESGELPMIADVHITAEPLLSKVKNKLVRELSCGYDYSIRRDGDKILQVDITGNHVAVVPKGRAGSEARINDAAPAAATSINAPLTKKKENRPVSNLLQHILGLGLKSYAHDAEPEKLAEAAEAIKAHQEPAGQTDDRYTKDRHADDRYTKDRHADDRHHRMHDALDRLLDDRHHGKDADLEALKALLQEFFTEEEEEPAHAAEDEVECDPTELEATLSGGEADDAEEEELEESELHAEDDVEGPGEETEPSGKEVVVNDRARAADGARAVLKMLRPVVARSGDSAVRQAFNTALSSVSRSSRVSHGSYGSFAGSARARDLAPKSRARGMDSGKDPLADLQRHYD